MHTQVGVHLPDVRKIVAGNVTTLCFCFAVLVLTTRFSNVRLLVLPQTRSCVLANPPIRHGDWSINMFALQMNNMVYARLGQPTLQPVYGGYHQPL
jgi:hypothetical protein